MEVSEGWTEPIDYELKADGTVIDLTGRTVTLQLYDRRGQAVAYAGQVSITGAQAGRVRFAPASTDLVAASSPYSARWKVSPDGYTVPNAQPLTWRVYKP